MPDHPRTPLPPATHRDRFADRPHPYRLPTEHDPDGRATFPGDTVAPPAVMDRVPLPHTTHGDSPRRPPVIGPGSLGPGTTCSCRGMPDRSAATDDRLSRMGDPANHSGGLSGMPEIRSSVEAPTVLRVTLDEGATLPTRQHETDAGLDLFALVNTLPRLMPHETRVFDTGVHVEIPPGYYGQVCGRSGMASRGVCPSGGVIDQSYRGSIGVVLTNHGQAQWVAEPGKAIAQLVLVAIATPTVMVVESLGETARGENGFGSSDRKDGNP